MHERRILLFEIMEFVECIEFTTPKNSHPLNSIVKVEQVQGGKFDMTHKTPSVREVVKRQSN